MRTVEVAEVATEIAATPRQVWEVRTDFPSCPRWTTRFEAFDNAMKHRVEELFEGDDESRRPSTRNGGFQ